MSWKLKKKFHDILDQERGYEKKIWGTSPAVCLAYPNYYRTGMSNLGFQTIYALINHHTSSVCERVFLPDPEDEALFALKSIPLFSMESQKPLTDFHILAFSVPFENDYPNILKILDMARITLLADQRGDDEPLIMGGGVSPSLNPEPLADFFDLFLLGEGEEVLPEFLHLFASCHALGMSRKELLLRIQREIAGAYVPQFYEIQYSSHHLIEDIRPVHAALPKRMEKRWIRNINTFTTEQCISTPATEFKDMFLTEVSRGCRRGCRFCAAGFLYKPARFRDLNTLASSFMRGINDRKRVGLLGTAVSDHPEIHSLCEYVLTHKGSVSMGSLRVDRLDERMVLLLAESGVETISLAPEAGTQRLRNVIQKGITDEHIENAVELIIAHGIFNIRLYFMVGLPTETEEDIEGIVHLVKRIKHHAIKCSAGKKRFRRITLSMNQFIPKPVTPFQWHPLENINLVRKKMRNLEGTLRREKSVKVIHDVPKWNYIQALLSLGDRRISKILLAAHKNNGNWSKAFKEVNVNPDFYVYRHKSFEEILPWDIIDHGISKQYLYKEFRTAMGSH